MLSMRRLQKAKDDGRPLTMATCYDYSMASILNHTDIDILLVGDTVAMVVHGHETTIPATMDMMALHLESVVRGAPDKIIVGDLPFMSYHKGESLALENMERLMRIGASCVKLEGAGNQKLVQKAVLAGIPVMAHLGLTPQSVHALGGYRIQGKSEAQAEQILQEALSYEAAGACAVVLECIPKELAAKVTQSLSIPTLGIGAGPDVNGQILVSPDLLGLWPGKVPKFVRQYMHAREDFTRAFQQFHKDVVEKNYPNDQECYSCAQ